MMNLTAGLKLDSTVLVQIGSEDEGMCLQMSSTRIMACFCTSSLLRIPPIASAVYLQRPHLLAGVFPTSFRSGAFPLQRCSIWHRGRGSCVYFKISSMIVVA